MFITPRAHARARGYVIGRGVYCILSGVSHNAKAATPYMRQNIKINIGVGGLHGNQSNLIASGIA